MVVVTALVFCRCCSAPRCQSERPQDGQEREGRRQPLPGLVPRYSVLDAVTWVRSGWRGAWCLQASQCLLCPAGRAAGWDASPRPSCGHAALHKVGSQRQQGSDLRFASSFLQGAVAALLLQLVKQISWLRSLPDARREHRSSWLSSLPAQQTGQQLWHRRRGCGRIWLSDMVAASR